MDPMSLMATCGVEGVSRAWTSRERLRSGWGSRTARAGRSGRGRDNADGRDGGTGHVARHVPDNTSRMSATRVERHRPRWSHRPAGPPESARANRRLVGRLRAREYQDEHGAFLGDADLLWCPEGLREADGRACSATCAGRDVLEVGCGAAQGARWLVRAGALGSPPSTSRRPAAAGPACSTRAAGRRCRGWCRPTRRRCRSATRASTSWCSAFGGIPFVADSAGAHARGRAGCCGPAGGWSSRSRTRCAGPSRTTRARPG